jgi:aerobic carbon-monoxide dehydrogenase large subunit
MGGMVVTPRLLGAPIKRGEDPRLLRGTGAYVEDIALPGLVHLVFARSPHAHARLPARLEVSAARAAPGVLAVVAADDLEGAFTGPLHFEWENKLKDAHRPERWPLARAKVRYVGEPVAAVVAETPAQANDALDLLEIAYAPLPSVTDPEAALAPDAPLLYEEVGSNLAHRMVKEGGDVEAAFTRPDVTIVRQRLLNPRVLPAPMEPRGVMARFEPGTDELTVWSSTQMPHALRTKLAAVLGLPENRVRVIAPDVGGGFGAKIDCSPEEVLAAWLAMRLGRPVRWVEARRENFQAMIHGRGQVDLVEAAATREGEIVGLKVRVLADIGAGYSYTTPVIATLTSVVLPGPYRTPAIRFELDGVFTNKTPVGAYRGAGRPEATYLLERIVDLVANALQLDPAEVRRRNFLPPEAFPYTTPLDQSYDSGNYAPALDRLLALADYAGLRRKQAAARQDQRRPLIGIGLSAYLEICAFGPWESATVRVEQSGTVTVLAGTAPHGQGHMTPFKQIVADQLGVPLDDIRVRFNDTATVPTGVGTFGSRSAAVGGSAVHGAAERVRDKVVRIAAEMLEAALEDIEIGPGRISVRGVPDRTTTLAGVADRAYSDKLPDSLEPGLEAARFFKPPAETFPFGMHLAVVEIDRETGQVHLRRYVAVDDCGRVLNPLLVDGQRHGGIAQGVGQALLEEVVYDTAGQLVTSTLGDYSLPRAAHFPTFELDRTETPTPRNPLGVKGIGEAGTIGSTPALVNAVVDALAPFGITHLDMPTTPERIWRALHPS